MGHCFGMPGRAAVSFFQFMFAYGGWVVPELLTSGCVHLASSLEIPFRP